MPRVRVKRELCDCFDCRDPSSLLFPNNNGGTSSAGGPQAAAAAAAADAVSEAIAQQRPPPKALLIFLDGQLQSLPTGSATDGTILDACKHPQLDAAARDGATGWLAFRCSSDGSGGGGSSSGGGDDGSAAAAAAGGGGLSQLAQLCGLPIQAPADASDSPAVGPSIEDRYKGMRAVLLACGDSGGGSDSSKNAAVGVGRAAGFYRSLTLQQAARELAPGGGEGGGMGAAAAAAAGETAVAAAAAAAGETAVAEGLPSPSDTADVIVSLLGVRHIRVQADGQQEDSGGTTAAANGAAPAAATTATVAAESDDDDEDDVDLLLLHVPLRRGEEDDGSGSVGGGNNPNSSSNSASFREPNTAAAAAAAAAAAVSDVRWADALVGELNNRPGFRRGVLLTLLVGDAGRLPLPQPMRSRGGGGGGGAQSPPTQQQQQLLQPLNADSAPGGFPAVALPRQSYQVQHEEEVDVAENGLALVAQRLPAVIRTDGVGALSLGGVAEGGGLRCVLAERLLPEVAYKLGRAPKYGA